MAKGAIDPHVLSDVPELACRSTWDLDVMTLLYVTWGSAFVQPRMQQMLPICFQGWHARDLFSTFGWSCGFGSSWCLSCLLYLVKLEPHMQHISLIAPKSTWFSEQDCAVPFPLAYLFNYFGGILHWSLWSEMIELNFARFKRNFGNDGPFLSSFIHDCIKIFSSHSVQHCCLSDLMVLLAYPDMKSKR